MKLYTYLICFLTSVLAVPLPLKAGFSHQNGLPILNAVEDGSENLPTDLESADLQSRDKKPKGKIEKLLIAPAVALATGIYASSMVTKSAILFLTFGLGAAGMGIYTSIVSYETIVDPSHLNFSAPVTPVILVAGIAVIVAGVMSAVAVNQSVETVRDVSKALQSGSAFLDKLNQVIESYQAEGIRRLLSKRKSDSESQR